MKIKVGSLFSGIGGFDLAFTQTGPEVNWQVEQDRDCLKVLAHHYPEVKRYHDVKEVGEQNLTAVDLICGGFPCQDLSVAGKRAGLDGERSGLWFEFHRIIRELRPAWVLIENVPGLLSSNSGRDFAIIISGLGELGYFTAWRVLDSQWFGVAQRRRRVFIVASLGNGRCAQVLFESSCGCGNTPARRETGERVAGTTEGGTSPTGWDYQRMRIHDADGTAPTMSQSDGKGGQRTPVVALPDPAYTLNARGGIGRIDGESETFAIRTANTQANGIGIVGDVSLDGAQGQCIAFAQNTRDEVRLQGGDGQMCGALAAEPGMKQTTYVAVSNRGDSPDDIAETVRTECHRALPMVAQIAYGEAKDIEVSPPLMANSGPNRHGQGSNSNTQFTAVVSKGNGECWESDVHTRLSSSGGGQAGQGYPACRQGMLVRRLTPTECARLQGFPDSWLSIPGLSDSAKYRMLGNAVTVSVIRWIAKRIVGELGMLCNVEVKT